MFQKTSALTKLLGLKKRIKGVAGGTSASKTISILQILIDKAQRDPMPKMTSVTSEYLPHLRRGAMRDFLNIMHEHNYYNDDRWNRGDLIYTFETGSKLEFFSLDQPHKVRGPRRDRLFVNEANNIPLETFDQLEVRTNEEIWLDWNPVSEFWWYSDILPHRDVDFITLTYKDNEALPQSIVDSIESRRNVKNWWKVYGLGELGDVEGRIYTGWIVIEDIPEEAKLRRYGLDFGYTNDPTAVDAIYEYNGGYIVDERIHQKGLSNRDIAKLIKVMPNALVVADSAEPKSIDELLTYGVPVEPAQKGQGSVNQGIQYVQAEKIYITKRSLDTLKEYRNYLWIVDKDGRTINEPSPIWNHHMDAIRYALENLLQIPKKEEEYLTPLQQHFRKAVNSYGQEEDYSQE